MRFLFFSSLFFSFFAQAQSVQPGMWEADTRFEINGIALPASKDKACVSSSDAKDIKKTISRELKEHGCVPTKWVSKGTQIQVSLKCQKSGLEAEGNLKGHIHSKSYALKGEAEGSFQEIPSQANISLQGKWVQTCRR